MRTCGCRGKIHSTLRIIDRKTFRNCLTAMGLSGDMSFVRTGFEILQFLDDCCRPLDGSAMLKTMKRTT